MQMGEKYHFTLKPYFALKPYSVTLSCKDIPPGKNFTLPHLQKSTRVDTHVVPDRPQNER